MIVSEDAFRWLRGEPRLFTTQSDSGATKECLFCAACGVRIYNSLSSMPGVINVKPGTLDDTSWLAPVWARS